MEKAHITCVETGILFPFPRISLPLIDAQLILNNSWFRLAKEMNLFFLGQVLLLVIIVAYIAILHAFGQVLLKLSSPSNLNATDVDRVPNEANKPSFEFIALSLDKPDFMINEMLEKVIHLTFKLTIPPIIFLVFRLPLPFLKS